MSYTIVIKSSSHYKYLWDIINDLTTNLSNLILYVDDSLDYKFNDNLELLYYDKNLAYSDRISYLIENIKTEYFVLLHDVDLIINFNENKFKEYLKFVKENNIDRLSLGVFNSGVQLCDGDISIGELFLNMSKNFLTPFDYAPSIYKKETIYQFYKKFPGISYKELELLDDVQNYFKDNLKSYGIQKNDKIDLIYHRGFVYTSDFNFLHITVAGNLLENESYFDLKEEFFRIKNKYNLSFLNTMPSLYIRKNEI